MTNTNENSETTSSTETTAPVGAKVFKWVYGQDFNFTERVCRVDLETGIKTVVLGMLPQGRAKEIAQALAKSYYIGVARGQGKVHESFESEGFEAE